MPAAGSVLARLAALKCGHLREAGNRRTSRTRSTPCAFRIATKSSRARLECPIVQIRAVATAASGARAPVLPGAEPAAPDPRPRSRRQERPNPADRGRHSLAAGAPDSLLVLPDRLDREGGVGADLGQEFLVLLGEGPAALVQELHDADNLAGRRPKRGGQYRAGAEARARVSRPVEPGVVVRVR